MDATVIRKDGWMRVVRNETVVEKNTEVTLYCVQIAIGHLWWKQWKTIRMFTDIKSMEHVKDFDSLSWLLTNYKRYLEKGKDFCRTLL